MSLLGIVGIPGACCGCSVIMCGTDFAVVVPFVPSVPFVDVVMVVVVPMGRSVEARCTGGSSDSRSRGISSPTEIGSDKSH